MGIVNFHQFCQLGISSLYRVHASVQIQFFEKFCILVLAHSCRWTGVRVG